VFTHRRYVITKRWRRLLQVCGINLADDLEVTGLLDLSGWPPGMRVTVRKERPHPGAQLRLTDVDGHRLTAFATNTPPGGPGRQLADLELRHRRPARRWEPKRLRLRLFSIAGRLARTGRRTVLHLPCRAPWAPLLLQAITSLRAGQSITSRHCVRGLTEGMRTAGFADGAY
jgi:hypothetical protein